MIVSREYPGRRGTMTVLVADGLGRHRHRTEKHKYATRD
jgi:hypothetical protein